MPLRRHGTATRKRRLLVGDPASAQQHYRAASRAGWHLCARDDTV